MARFLQDRHFFTASCGNASAILSCSSWPPYNSISRVQGRKYPAETLTRTIIFYGKQSARRTTRPFRNFPGCLLVDPAGASHPPCKIYNFQDGQWTELRPAVNTSFFSLNQTTNYGSAHTRASGRVACETAMDQGGAGIVRHRAMNEASKGLDRVKCATYPKMALCSTLTSSPSFSAYIRRQDFQSSRKYNLL